MRALDRPLATGATLFGVLLLGLLGQQLVLDRVPFGAAGEPTELWTAVLHCALAAYVPAAFLAVLRSAQRQLAALRERPGELTAGLRVRVPLLGRPSRGWWLALAAGLAVGVLGPWLTEPALSPLHYWDPRRWPPEVFWHRLPGLWVTTWMAAFVFATIEVSRQFSEAARRLEVVDLFDSDLATPFARQGLSNALLAAVLFSLVSLFWFDHGVTPLLVLAGGLTIALTGLALLLPVRSVQQRYRAAQAAELRRCDRTLARARDRFRAALDDVGAGAGSSKAGVAAGSSAAGERSRPGRLADLAAYRAEVERVRTWPFDTPTLRRIAVYLLIPIGSWVASALVQSVVERWM